MVSNSSFQVVQISDTHLFADANRELLGLRTVESLGAVLAAIKDLSPQPDLILLTGDLSQDETVRSYERLRDLMTPLGIPTYWLPGNHDQQIPMLELLLHSATISGEKVFQHRGWNFVLLNSAQPGRVEGHLPAAALQNLEQTLQQLPDQPTLIALHHPPCPIGSDWMDQIRLQDSEDFCGLVDRYPQVKLVLFGHIHQAFATQRQGVHYWGCPSTCVQFKPQQPGFAIDQQQPGYRLITLHADGTAETVVQRVQYQRVPDLAATGY
ncbi:MAG: 3',5'-cyclic-AMP phosphodiesterase [Elainella sp.]